MSKPPTESRGMGVLALHSTDDQEQAVLGDFDHAFHAIVHVDISGRRKIASISKGNVLNPGIDCTKNIAVPALHLPGDPQAVRPCGGALGSAWQAQHGNS
jgi:hypothetical protein